MSNSNIRMGKIKLRKEKINELKNELRQLEFWVVVQGV